MTMVSGVDFIENLRRELAAEIKSDIQQEMLDRIIKVISSSLSGMTIPAAKINFNPEIHPSPTAVNVDVETPSVYITNELDLSEFTDALKANTQATKELTALQARPIKRTVYRNGADNNIDYMIEERI